MLLKNLKNWFIAHFIIDFIFAIPLIFIPQITLTIIGLDASGNLLTAKIVGCALIAIGGNSFLMRNSSIETYQSMLKLKLLWSGSIIFSILLSFNELKTETFIFLLSTFTIFFFVWLYYFKKLKKEEMKNSHTNKL